MRDVRLRLLALAEMEGVSYGWSGMIRVKERSVFVALALGR